MGALLNGLDEDEGAESEGCLPVLVFLRSLWPHIGPMGKADDISFRGGSVPQAALEFSYIRASGPGGQNVNKLATAAQLRFDATACPAIDPVMMTRLRILAGQRMTMAGVIIITARRFRRQELNHNDAIARLAELLREAAEPPKYRRPTRPNRGSKEKRLKQKKVRAGIKHGRGRVIDS
jgi:ribosome-associated protein